jgi:putative sigma-54 modulation protein
MAGLNDEDSKNTSHKSGLLQEFLVQINISTRHGHISDATREKITAKLEKLSRLFERLTAIEVTLDVEHEDDPHVELKVSAEHKHDFVATDRGGTLMASLDNCMHKLEQQLRKYKEKVLDRHRTPGNRQVEGAAESESQ